MFLPFAGWSWGTHGHQFDVWQRSDTCSVPALLLHRAPCRFLPSTTPSYPRRPGTLRSSGMSPGARAPWDEGCGPVSATISGALKKEKREKRIKRQKQRKKEKKEAKEKKRKKKKQNKKFRKRKIEQEKKNAGTQARGRLCAQNPARAEEKVTAVQTRAAKTRLDGLMLRTTRKPCVQRHGKTTSGGTPCRFSRHTTPTH